MKVYFATNGTEYAQNVALVKMGGKEDCFLFILSEVRE